MRRSSWPSWMIRQRQRGVAHLDAMLARLASGEPLQYVLGRWGFRHLDLMVDQRVLIPRPETETVVETALQLARSLPRPIVCADLGTGSGAIGLSLATELGLEGVTVWMTDRSPEALEVARANAAGVGRAAVNVRLDAWPLVRGASGRAARAAGAHRVESPVCRRRRCRTRTDRPRLGTGSGAVRWR